MAMMIMWVLLECFYQREKLWSLTLLRISPYPLAMQGSFGVRGPCVMKGYINIIDPTEEPIDENGWLRTGDLVKFDEHGYLYIMDRLKELIKYKAYQVAPAELEDLTSHPALLDCAVIPCSDKEAGQVPMACIVWRGGHDITPDEIMHWVANQVAPYKKLQKVAFMDIIPKSTTDKILCRELVKLMTLKSSL